MKLKNYVLIDLDGEPLRMQTNPQLPPTPDAPVVTLARIFINAALSPAQGQPYSPEQNGARYAAAVKLHDFPENEEFEVSKNLVAALMKDVNRLYAPLVAGQVQALVYPDQEAVDVA